MEFMSSYDWPGNVRELENAVISAALKCTSGTIGLADLPQQTVEGSSDRGSDLRLDEMERKLIEEALARANGNKTEAARLLGITRRSLYSRINSLASKANHTHCHPYRLTGGLLG